MRSSTPPSDDSSRSADGLIQGIGRRLREASARVAAVLGDASAAEDPGTAFLERWRRCGPFTLASVERTYALHRAILHAVAAGIPGDVVECGVWRGGSAMAAALALMDAKDRDRRIWLYDTFEGMPEPETRDLCLRDGHSARSEWERHEKGGRRWLSAGIEEVRASLASTGFPAGRLAWVPGLVEERIPAEAPERVSVLRLDTSLHRSTLHALRHLFPRLSPGGILVLDDYGYWQGVRDAADAYLRESGQRMILHPIDDCGSLGVRPGPA